MQLFGDADLRGKTDAHRRRRNDAKMEIHKIRCPPIKPWYPVKGGRKSTSARVGAVTYTLSKPMSEEDFSHLHL